MRVGFVIDWNIDISSLMVLARNMFRELGELMNEKQTFTVTAITQNLLGVGDINPVSYTHLTLPTNREV